MGGGSVFLGAIMAVWVASALFVQGEERMPKGRRGGHYSTNPASDQSGRSAVILAPLSAPPTTSTATAVGYREDCNEARGLVCNSKALLKCYRARCACIKPDDMIFDMTKGRCVAKAGAKCIYEDESFKSVACVMNAVCGSDGYCRCSPRFYNSLNVTCITQKSFGTYCHFDHECREDHHLRCISDRCQCDPRVSIKHRKYELCLGLAGEVALDGNCIEFTERVSVNPNSSPIRCECQSGYVKGAEKKCHGSFGQPCTVDSPCQEEFKCIQGVCQCPAQLYQSYDAEKHKCRSNAYGPCSHTSDCIPEALCNTTGVFSRCECREGYIIGVSRNCEKSMGMPCQMPQHPGALTNETLDECSDSAKLLCIDGRCNCPAMRHFSQRFEKCVGMANSICVLRNEPNPICTENAECTYKYERLGFGLCTCLQGYRTTPRRRCAPVEAPEEEQIEDEILAGNATLNPPEVKVSTTTPAAKTTVKPLHMYKPLIPANVDIEQLKNDTKNQHLWEFFLFLNDTLHGEFNNASFKRFMKKDWFRLPD